MFLTNVARTRSEGGISRYHGCFKHSRFLVLAFPNVLPTNYFFSFFVFSIDFSGVRKHQKLAVENSHLENTVLLSLDYGATNSLIYIGIPWHRILSKRPVYTQQSFHIVSLFSAR